MSRLAWPLPALLAWGACWVLFIALSRLAAPLPVALTLAIALGLVLALPLATRWRRVFVAAGFPLSLAASGMAAGLPAWAWLLALGALALIYPINTWRDAPMFPTPPQALKGLAGIAPLPAGARVLDAGCGLGDGLRELRREYPLAQISGVEWSWPLRLACALRCRFARVSRGDLWASDWSRQDLVYLFQRPESMPRALEKARRELRPGTWLASLEFEAPGLRPTAVMRGDGRKTVWLYRAPLR
ncbi:MAG: trans-aconitate 2-methyltransferase [Piscinibacter sp.]|uniref:class I SAM-dependent methyltransferase n=1 Tax=Piscinibacter sp. TaxID=1903157 RepID=UPI003D128132